MRKLVMSVSASLLAGLFLSPAAFAASATPAAATTRSLPVRGGGTLDVSRPSHPAYRITRMKRVDADGVVTILTRLASRQSKQATTIRYVKHPGQAGVASVLHESEHGGNMHKVLERRERVPAMMMPDGPEPELPTF